jgi:hypothetical protein
MTTDHDLDTFSAEKSLPSSPSLLEEMHESMSALLQELFESQHRILSFSEETPFLAGSKKSPMQIAEEQKRIQFDLQAVQNLLHQLGLLFKNNQISKALPASTQESLPMEERLKKTWGNLQEQITTSPKQEGSTPEMGEMQKWVQIALKQVEKSLDLMQKIPTKCQ